jgi:hypothetical protein
MSEAVALIAGASLRARDCQISARGRYAAYVASDHVLQVGEADVQSYDVHVGHVIDLQDFGEVSRFAVVQPGSARAILWYTVFAPERNAVALGIGDSVYAFRASDGAHVATVDLPTTAQHAWLLHGAPGVLAVEVISDSAYFFHLPSLTAVPKPGLPMPPLANVYDMDGMDIGVYQSDAGGGPQWPEPPTGHPAIAYARQQLPPDLLASVDAQPLQ